MRKLLILILTLLALAIPASALDVAQTQAEQFGVSDLERAVPEGARAWTEDLNPMEQADFGAAIGQIFEDTLRESGPIWRSTASLMLRVLLIVILCLMVESVAEERTSRVTVLAGAAAIMACCAADMGALVGLGRETMEEISSFSSLLMPVLAATAGDSRGAAGASGLYAVTAAFSGVLIRLATGVFLPLVYAYLALALVDAALQQDRLQGLKNLLGWAITNGLKGVMYLYTGFMAVTGVLSGTADAATLKAAKMTISSVVPVVGGIISDAAETVLSSAGLLRSAVGTFGMVAVVGAFAAPFCRIGISYLAFKVAAALSGVLGSRHGGLLEALTSAAGYVLAMVASATVMTLLACCCFMKVAQL